MQSTTVYAGVSGLTDAGAEPRVFDVGGLAAALGSLTDLRQRKGLRYELVGVLVLVVLAKLSGEDQPRGIADWVSFRQEELISVLGLGWKRVPHEDTYRRVLGEAVDVEQFEQVSSEQVQGLAEVGRSIIVSIDGKSLCGTISKENSRPEHLLAAYLPEEGIVLMQVAAGDRDNEIKAAPVLLGYLDLRGKIVIGDAMQTQRALSIQILEASADYLWFAKDNQPTLRQDIEQLFEADPRTVIGGKVENDFALAKTTDKGHGRLETRRITVSGELKGYSNWPGLEQVFRLERRRVDLKTGKVSTETVYGLTSLSPKRASAKRLLYLTRTYWGIENGLHQVRDVTFREDRCRLTRGNAGRVMASINNLVINLLRHSGATNLARARRQCNANLNLALSLLHAS